MSLAHRTFLSRLVIGALFSLLALSCQQYEYDTPSPGILEIRMRSKNSRTELLPFAGVDSNAFGFMSATLRKIVAKRSDGVQMELYSDLVAIRRNPDGDQFNCLDRVARDSAYVLGQVYAPPHAVTQIDLEMAPAFGPDAILTFKDSIFNSIELRQPLGYEGDLNVLPFPGHAPFNITVEEGRLTRVTITFDLDSALVRRTEWFDYRPYFYVSSVQIF